MIVVEEETLVKNVEQVFNKEDVKAVILIDKPFVVIATSSIPTKCPIVQSDTHVAGLYGVTKSTTDPQTTTAGMPMHNNTVTP
ncbi:hypothetical protein Tco_0808246 [Tanacetum coccineum]